MRSNIDGARLENNLWMGKNKLGVMKQTITTTFVIDDDMPPIIGLSAAAPQDVTLPAVTKGLWFFIASTGADTLTVKNAGGSTIGTVPTLTVSYFVSDGTSWFSWTAGIVSATNLTLTGNLVVQGNSDIGNAVTDTIGFYGSTKVAQRAGASQAVVTQTLKTALVTTLKTALVTTMLTAAGTTGAIKTTGAAYGFTTSTQANKIRALVNQGVVDIASIKARVDQGVVDVASIKARVDQAVIDNGNVIELLNEIRLALKPTTGVGLIKGSA